MKKLKPGFLDWATSHLKWFKITSYLFNGIAIVTLIVWAFKLKIVYLDGFELEALFAILSGVGVFLNQIHRKLLEKAEYSPAHVLAYGYVNNFLAPIVLQLKDNGETNPKVFVYKPRKIDELFESNIDMMKAELKNRNYSLDGVKLNLRQARARDVLTIQHSQGKKVYFDFPNTLLSLLDYIDYKIDSKANNSSEEEKANLTAELVTEFYQKVDELTEHKRIKSNIKYCDSNLKIF